MNESASENEGQHRRLADLSDYEEEFKQEKLQRNQRSAEIETWDQIEESNVDKIEDSPLLLQTGSKSDVELPKKSDCLKIKCCSDYGISKKFQNMNVPPALKKTWKVISSEPFKIAFITVVFIVGVAIFSITKEPDMNELQGVSLATPLVIPLDSSPTDLRPVLEVRLDLPQAQSETELTISIYACNNENNCEEDALLYELLDNPWEVTLDSLSPTYQLPYAFYMPGINHNNYHSYQYRVTTDSKNSIGFVFESNRISRLVEAQIAIAAVILVFVYVLISFELFHRTIVALVGSFIALAIYSLIHGRVTFEEVLSWIDFETITLLFGMMVIVAIFAQTGFFEWFAVKAYKLSRGNLWLLTMLLCIFTGITSAFLDNVTTILLLTPVTIRLCKVLDVKPEPILLAEVFFSNIGGTATVVGDPPNVIIANDKRIKALANVSFFEFSLHMGPGVVAAAIAVLIFLYFTIGKSLSRMPHMSMEKEINLWKKTAQKINGLESPEQAEVKQKLLLYISKLEEEALKTPEDKYNITVVDIEELEKTYVIKNKALFINCCIVIVLVMILFFSHSLIKEWVDLSLAWSAIVGAIVLMLIAGVHDVDELLEKVEFGTLLFFAGLFILMHALELFGLFEYIGDQTSKIVGKVPAGNSQLAVAVVAILWVSAIASAFIDNIPFTTAMIPIVIGLAEEPLNLPITPLIWAMSFGNCFGGNGTLIGASCNVVAVSLAGRDGYHISFFSFLKLGMPVMLLSVSVVTVYLLVFHVLIPWY